MIFNNQFGREIPFPSGVLLYLLVSILFILFHPSIIQGKELCFRKYDTKRAACKYLVEDRNSSENRTRDIEICCSTYGLGHASELKRMTQLRRKWYACTPCNQEGLTEIEQRPLVREESGLAEDTPGHVDMSHQAAEDHTGDEAVDRRSNTELDTGSTFSFDDLLKEFSDEEKSRKNLNETSANRPTENRNDWGPWSDWSGCSRTCGPPDGTQRRTRRKCSGDLEDCAEEYEEKVCQPDLHCRVDGGWSNWTVSPCSVTCGEGHQVLSRLCNSPIPAGGGRDCEGDMEEVRPCVNPVCPVDGRWSDWSDWTPCPAVCAVGVQTRIRTCNNPLPSNGGRPCRGLQEQSAPCSSRNSCSVNGNWSEWSKWDICSARPCSGQVGHRIRFRTCTNPRPMFGGRPCRGRTWARETCYNNEYCTETVNGDWCDWSNWTECSAEVQIRTRMCQCPPPANGGTECNGVNMEERICLSSTQSDVLPAKTRTQRSGERPAGCSTDLGSGGQNLDDSTPDCEEEDRGDEQEEQDQEEEEEEEEGSTSNDSGL